MIKTLEHDYRILLNSYANKGDHNFSQLDRYEEREALVSQQRSIEFFHLFINKKQLINPTHPRFRILILPPQSLTELQLSFAEKIISLFAFGIMVTLTSFTRSIKTILSILSLPSSPGLNKKTDGFIYQKLPPRSLDAKTSGDYEMGTWLAKNYFHKPLHILKLNSINTSSFVSACCLSLKIKILTQSIFMFALYLLYLLSGKWERLYLLDDRIKCKLVRQCCIDALSNHYFFCFQGTPYRPLWTWDAEKRGSKIIQYFNSSSAEPALDGKIHDNTLNHLSCWPEIIPFNKTFLPQLKKQVKYETLLHSTPTIRINDWPDFSLNTAVNTQLKTNNNYLDNKQWIGLFDIAPIKSSRHIGFSKYNDYFNSLPISVSEYFEQFYQDCLDVAEKLNARVVVKPKTLTSRTCTFYIDLINRLEMEGKLLILPSDLSPYRVMDKCALNIVQPFTSPGYYTECKRKVCFYDPVSVLTKQNDYLFENILCLGKFELDNWVKMSFPKRIEV
tara:strand:- start:2832 stop:4340 length:1509 start_codon:yes stop_codon:yes gene_type:complete